MSERDHMKQEIEKSLALFLGSDDVFEIRLLDVGRKGATNAGWFTLDDVSKASSQIVGMEGKASGAYFTPQRLQADILTRARRAVCGQVRKVDKDGKQETNPKLTHDTDVVEWRYLLIDVDPVRAAGFEKCSANEAEKLVARGVLDSVKEFFGKHGWADPLTVDSGNGYHAYYCLPRPISVSREGQTDTVPNVLLSVLDSHFGSDATAEIDVRVGNASRIMKIPGTWSRKGLDTQDRPHRKSRIIDVPADWRNADQSNARLISELVDELDKEGTKRAATRIVNGEFKAPDNIGIPDDRTTKRARAYLLAMPDSVDRNGGSNPALTAARMAVWGFGLGEVAGLNLIMDPGGYNATKCYPPWEQRDWERMCYRIMNVLPPKNPFGWKRDESSSEYDHRNAPDIRTPRAGVDASAAVVVAPATTAAAVGVAEPVTSAAVAPTGKEPVQHEDDPHRLANVFMKDHVRPEGMTLAFWRGKFYEWLTSYWRPVADDEIKTDVNGSARRHLEYLQSLTAKNNPGDVRELPKVTRVLVSNITAAIEQMTILRGLETNPAWIRGGVGPSPTEIVSARNGLVHLPKFERNEPGAIIRPTPLFFSTSSVDFDVSFDCPEPVEWYKFLASVWPTDPDSILLLQEWFGYLLLPDNTEQKILCLQGKRRSGKGTIQDVIKKLVGEKSAIELRADDVSGAHVMASLVGKSVVIFDDFVLPSDKGLEAKVRGLLVQLSGGGSPSINPKHREAYTEKLSSRIVMSFNNLPAWRDSSNAIGSRMSILNFPISHLGKEDKTLGDRLTPEMPGVFKWAAAGRLRLKKQGGFTLTESSRSVREEIEDSSSQIGLFVSNHCIVNPDEFKVDSATWVWGDDLYAKWCDFNNFDAKDSTSVAKRTIFGRDLFPLHPGLVKARARKPDAGRQNKYFGIRLRTADDDEADKKAEEERKKKA